MSSSDITEPDLRQLREDPTLIDTIGSNLARELIEEKKGDKKVDKSFGETQLRKIHSELIRLNRLAASLRARADIAPQNQMTELKRGVVRLSYIITYQHARQMEKHGSGKAKAINKYFSFMKKMVTQLKGSQDLPNDIEAVFNVSESIIAYYNYFDQTEKERRSNRHG